MLFTLQRYEFFSKSQPIPTNLLKPFRCCLPYKGTNFSANHNVLDCVLSVPCDVVYPTKVRIFQQITTTTETNKTEVLMLFTLQRYEFFSKSQLYSHNKCAYIRCCLPYKGTNFSANHNSVGWLIIGSLWCCLHYKGTNFSANHNFVLGAKNKVLDVVYPTKVRIFQQITTVLCYLFKFYRMLFTLQRYEFFSKSQRGWQHFILSPVISKFKPNNFS